MCQSNLSSFFNNTTTLVGAVSSLHLASVVVGDDDDTFAQCALFRLASLSVLCRGCVCLEWKALVFGFAWLASSLGRSLAPDLVDGWHLPR